jgi:hypothetical protein
MRESVHMRVESNLNKRDELPYEVFSLHVISCHTSASFVGAVS